jgi:hypothetical protein
MAVAATVHAGMRLVPGVAFGVACVWLGLPILLAPLAVLSLLAFPAAVLALGAVLAGGVVLAVRPLGPMRSWTRGLGVGLAAGVASLAAFAIWLVSVMQDVD